MILSQINQDAKIIMATTFKLASIIKTEAQVKFRGRSVPKIEETYIYEADNGAKLSFRSHPTKAWNFIIVQEHSNDAGIALRNKVIDAYVENGLKQHNFASFEEAISTLTV